MPEVGPRDGDLDLIEAALERIAAGDDWQLTDEVLLGQMDRLGTIGERVFGVRMSKIRAVDDRGSCPEVGAYATSDHLTLSDRAEPRHAKHVVKTAKDLRRYPLLQRAMEAARMTREQLNSVLLGLRWVPDTATAEDLVPIEKELIERAASHPPRSMRSLANKLVAVHFPEAEDDRLADHLERDHARAHRERSVTWRRDGHGSMFIRINLPELDGEKFDNLITAFTKQPHRGADRLDPDEESRTLDQRRADAFVELLDLHVRHETAPQSGGDRPNVSVIIRLDDLVQGTAGATLVNSGELVPPSVVRRLACEANVIPVVLGGHGEVLDVGGTRRTVTPAIRRALIVRDLGCVFPGCDVGPNRCDAHHIIPWYAGGGTALANLVLLCRHHHRIVEPDPKKPPGGQWTIAMDDHGIPWVRPPIRVFRTGHPSGTPASTPDRPRRLSPSKPIQSVPKIK